MKENNFKIKYQGKEIDLDIESSQLQLWCANDFDKKIGLFVNIQAQGNHVELFDEANKESYEHYIKPRIYTEWLEIPIESIQGKDFRTLETIKVNFKDAGQMDEIERLIWTEAPGALYVDNHGVFEEVRITFKYLGEGQFKVNLSGVAEFNTPFDVSANIPFEVELKAYDKRASKEDILNFFEKVLSLREFDYDWKYRDEDIFFIAKPKELKNVC
jgi:hypothetical protein